MKTLKAIITAILVLALLIGVLTNQRQDALGNLSKVYGNPWGRLSPFNVTCTLPGIETGIKTHFTRKNNDEIHTGFAIAQEIGPLGAYIQDNSQLFRRLADDKIVHKGKLALGLRIGSRIGYLRVQAGRIEGGIS